MKFFKHSVLITAIILLPLVTYAQGATGGTNNSGGVVGGTNNSIFQFNNPLKVDTICGALKLFLNALLTLAIPVAVLFLVYSGFLFVWARGSKTGLTKAKANLFYTIIGIGIFMGAWLIGQVILNTLNELARGAGQPGSQITDCR